MHLIDKVDMILSVPSLLHGLIGFVLGAIAGSFIATILIRWPQGRSVTTGHSYCDGCGERLQVRELVPLLSYLWCRGRCRRCGARIDARHFALEAAAAVMGAIAFVVLPGITGIVTALFGWWLLLVAALDVEHHWLPDRLTLPLIPVGLGIAWWGMGSSPADRLIGAVVGYALLAGIAFAYRRLRGRDGMGGGDPKLFAALGAWLGWALLPWLLLGAGLLGLAAIAMMRLRGRDIAADDRLPLGALLAMAAWPIWLVIA